MTNNCCSLRWPTIAVEQWCRRQGVQAHPLKFWLGENPGKIWTRSVKTFASLKMWAKFLKIRAKVMCFDLKKSRPKSQTRFLQVIRNTVFVRKKCPKYFSGKFGEIRAKMRRTPKILPARTSVEQWHHRKPASSISTSVTTSVANLLTTGKFNLPTRAIAFSFLLWSTALLAA